MKTNIVINDDCLSFMKSLPDKCIDLCLTDPPYGIGAYKDGTMGGGVLAKQSTYTKVKWDDFTPDEKYFNEIQRISKNSIIWGGNYFSSDLPNSNCWIVWDKDNGNNNFADCELAWTDFKTAVRKFKWKWQGMLQERMGKDKEERYHPTQKPIELFSWILENYSKENDIIFDPFAGSGTTAISCINMNRQYILIEKEKEYFDIINKRIASHNDGNLLNYTGAFKDEKNK